MNPAPLSAEEKTAYLCNAHSFNEPTARAYAETNGHCMYCGDDVFSHWHSYSSAQVDHILPQSKYPDFYWHPQNLVLACFFCNTTKKDEDFLHQGENPQDMLSNKRETLIARIRDHLGPEIKKRKQDFVDIKNALRR